MTRMLAQVEADAGETADSDALYVALLAASPRDAVLLSGHGQNLIREKRYAEALRAFQAATAADPGNGEAWNGLAFARFSEPPAGCHTARSGCPVKNLAGKCNYPLPLGDSLRYASRQEASHRLLSPVSGCRLRKAPGSGMAGAATAGPDGENSLTATTISRYLA